MGRNPPWPERSLSLSLFALLCFAPGLGGWAVPTPRSVERPHPVSLSLSLCVSLPVLQVLNSPEELSSKVARLHRQQLAGRGRRLVKDVGFIRPWSGAGLSETRKLPQTTV